MILIALLLAGCVTGPTKATKPTPELVARQFEAAVFGNDFGAGSPVLLRWTGPLLIDASGGDFDKLVHHKNDLEKVLEDIKQLTGISYGPPSATALASVGLNFLKREQFLYLVAALPNKPEYADEVARTSACFGFIFGDKTKGVITGAAIAIGADIPEDRRRHCIPEELVQIMGLPGDACHYRPSLICEGERDIFELQPADKLMLTVLYDPALKPGMSKAKAMPIARRLIRERWGEYMGR